MVRRAALDQEVDGLVSQTSVNRSSVPLESGVDLLNLQKGRSLYLRNRRPNAVDNGQDLGSGDAKASFGRDRFLAFN